MKNVKTWAALIAAVVAIGVTVWLAVPVMLRDGDGAEQAGTSVREDRPATAANAPARQAAVSTAPKAESSGFKIKSKPKPVLDIAEDEDDEDEENEDGIRRTPEERQLAREIEKALDDEDIVLARACAAKALNCRVRGIREAMVDTLGWFGEPAIAELTPFLADPDEDIADNAMNEWDMAVSSIENDAEKIRVVEMAMQIISNEDALESMSGEYIGVDERMAVESLLRVIEAGANPNGVAKAKETYEFVTGEEFTDRAAVEKWIAEEYIPEEADE